VRVLLLSARPDLARIATLARALADDDAVELVVAPAGTRALGADADAVVDGDPVGLGPELALALRHRVEAGLPLLALGSVPASAAAGERAGPWVDLLGAVVLPARPETELFVSVVDAADALTRRLPPELAVVDQLQPVQLCSPHSTCLLRAQVAYQELDALVSASRGAGRVTVSGLGGTDTALAHPEVRRVLRRSLRPAPGGSPAAERPLGLAVVGYGAYGGMGQIHGRAAGAVDGLELVAAVDHRPERRKAAEQDFPGAWAGASVDELVRADEVDVVVVATPPSSHAALGLQLLRAGKHVVCEKPMCLTVAEADSLIDAARAEGRTFTVNQSRRWDPDFLALRRAVDGGHLGEVFNVERADSSTRAGPGTPRSACPAAPSTTGDLTTSTGSFSFWVRLRHGSRPHSTSGCGTTSPTPTRYACTSTGTTAKRRSSSSPTWPPSAAPSSTSRARRGRS
jgi:hypothetical protein